MFFWADRKTKKATLASDWLRLLSAATDLNSTKLDRIKQVLYQVCDFWLVIISTCSIPN